MKSYRILNAPHRFLSYHGSQKLVAPNAAGNLKDFPKRRCHLPTDILGLACIYIYNSIIHSFHSPNKPKLLFSRKPISLSLSDMGGALLKEKQESPTKQPRNLRKGRPLLERVFSLHAMKTPSTA
uniref:Uncharacterized protein n=1 Tax=Salix viminalis TaxID=40686 RepID=A0A6N2LIB4_SALVM